MHETILLPINLYIGCSSAKDKYPLTYTPFSKTVVHINFRSSPVDSLSINTIAFTNIPRDVCESNNFTVIKAGNYYLSMEIDRPVKSFMNLGDKQYNVFVFPQDTTHVNVNFTSSGLELNFYGRQK